MVPVYQSFAEAKAATNVSEITIDKPAGVVEGDLMVAVMALRDCCWSSGWTPLVDTFGDYLVLSTLYKIAGADEPSSYTFSWASASPAYACILRITGYNEDTFLDSSGTTESESSANPTCPSVVTTEDDCLVLRLFIADDNSIDIDSGYPSGTTGITVDYSGSADGPSCGIAYEPQETAGATGTAVFSLTASEAWGTTTIAIAPEGLSSLTGAAVVSSTTSGVLKADRKLAGTSVTASTTTGAIKLTQKLIGTSAISSTVTCELNKVAKELAGAAVIVCTTGGVMKAVRTLAGSVVIDSTAAGELIVTGTKLLAGVVVIKSTATGNIIYVTMPPFMHKDLIDPYSGGAWLWLCEIAVSGYATQRIARNTEDVPFDGEDFEKFNLQIGEQMFSGDGSIPRVTLRVFQDVNRVIEDMVNETEGALGADIKLIKVCEKYLDYPVAALQADYENLAAESDSEWVTFTLGIPNPLTQRIPLRIYSSSSCPEATPTLFKGSRCRYPGADPTCTGAYEDCYQKGNAVHWGGELGLDPNVI